MRQTFTALVLLGIGFALYSFFSSPQLSQGEHQVVAGRYADVDVVKIGEDGWRMYFGVEPESPGNQREIYTAYSDNGLNWTRDDQAILMNAAFPDAVQLPDGQIRLYVQGDPRAISSLISSDGVHFTAEAGKRLEATAEFAAGGVGAPSVIQTPNGDYLMVYRADMNGAFSSSSINAKTTALVLAISTDGLAFENQRILVDGRNRIFGGYVDGPELFVGADGFLHLRFWTSAGYGNTEDAGQYELLSMDLGTSWSAPHLVLSTQESGVLGGDPTYAWIDGDLVMYYTKYGQGIFYQTVN